MGSFRKFNHSARLQRKFPTIRLGLIKPEQTGHSWQSAMYKLPLINDAVFLCISGIIVLNAVSIHWFPFFLTQKFIPFRCYKNSVQCHPLIFKKAKFNCRFSSLIRKFESGGKSTIIRKMRLPSNDVEICFLNWWSAFMFASTNGLIEYENIDLSAAYFGGFSTKNSPVFWVFRRFNEIISMNRS